MYYAVLIISQTLKVMKLILAVLYAFLNDLLIETYSLTYKMSFLLFRNQIVDIIIH